jgi:hypothetical protein
MKIHSFKTNREQGSLILTSMFIAGIIGVALASYLMLVGNQNLSVYRSQTWNSSIPLAEAGTEEALALINKYSGTSTTPENWTNSASADGWSSPAPGVYYVQRFLGNDYYQVYITNLNDKPTIKATGTMQWNYQLASAAPETMFAAIGVPTPSTSVSRAVLLSTGRNSPFSGGILVKKGITLSGGIVIDSFNSQNPNYSTNGQYVLSKHKDGGDIGTIESNVVAVVTDSGGADVYGHVATGPNSTVNSSGNGAIGSIGWISGGNRGVQPGWGRSDMNVVIQDPSLPDLSAFFPHTQLNGFPSGPASNGTNYTYLISPAGGSGKYMLNGNPNLSGSQSIYINGNVALDFPTGFSTSGQAYIYITPGSTLKMYFGGNVNLSGGGVVNGSSYATNCACFGLPGCTSFAYSGNSGFVGTIYAPEANVALSGGGSTGMNYVGALVGNSVNISGNYTFHYDESLGGPVQQTFYYVTSWQEVTP